MNTLEARDLAVKYNQTWPKGPPTDLWEEAFADLEPGRVGTVWARLAKAGDTHVTIPRFFEQYNALRTTDASTRPNRADCGNCQNSGWAPVYDTITCADGTTIERDTGVQPCRCAWGRGRETVHQSIIDWNEAELERIAPGRAARKAADKDATTNGGEVPGRPAQRREPENRPVVAHDPEFGSYGLTPA